MQAIRIIHDEHRSYAAVLHAMLYLTREIRLRATKPDFPLFRAMVYYLDTFVERFHHPKEDEYVFKLLCRRYPDAGPLVERLHSEHQAGGAMLRALEQALTRYEDRGAREFPAFAVAVQAYASFEWALMRAVDDGRLPLARLHLTGDDWRAVDDAFGRNGEPLVGAQAGTEYDALFRRIVNLAPPPIGVGPPAR
jgi:hemerythrin-like domain-containing protein